MALHRLFCRSKYIDTLPGFCHHPFVFAYHSNICASYCLLRLHRHFSLPDLDKNETRTPFRSYRYPLVYLNGFILGKPSNVSKSFSECLFTVRSPEVNLCSLRSNSPLFRVPPFAVDDMSMPSLLIHAKAL